MLKNELGICDYIFCLIREHLKVCALPILIFEINLVNFNYWNNTIVFMKLLHD